VNEVILLIRQYLREEIIGAKGGVRYYQMGGTLPDELYNLDHEGRPTRNPGVLGLKRRRARKSKRARS
jgi:hypothetical protein